MMPLISQETLHKKTPQELTLLLYEAALNNLELAESHIDEANFEQVNKHLQKTSDILERLGVGLNYDAGILSDQLEQIYNYLADEVVTANFLKDKKRIRHVHEILQSLFIAWIEAVKGRKDSIDRMNIKQTNAYEKNASYK
ncbi:flagellar export chaperone FliS [Alkalicoccobacillus plakortidis]|uniref:Flagellar export chaperone FliS n=1 Tax=Alkalicoccobacillus plakortidis TaxID=444060 RepID=A0ABT0XPC3_9BACI|nr:flagellar export chaperone FliS [Alkalicoccobacillus plakortidis]MCM2677762.1 flagellar export chaperone FliS [Alkalicoccobacillus plakortidis]